MNDRFRKIYKQIGEENSNLITEIKEIAEQLEVRFQVVPSREMSLAITNLEQSIMWATKAVVIEDEKRLGQALWKVLGE